MEWFACSDEYEKMVMRINKPRVVIDNETSPNTTVIKVDSARRHGILLDSVQVLTDMCLSIRKAYISSDGKWNMDVFYVTDLNGQKLVDQEIMSYIEKSIETFQYNKTDYHASLTTLELTGTERIGLLSEIFAVLSELDCDVVEGRVWTHNGRIASLIRIKDKDSGLTIDDPEKINQIEMRLKHVLKGDSIFRVSNGSTHTERRLHQLMFADRDYEKKFDLRNTPVVTVQNLEKRGYSVVSLQCKDRAKLVFDVVCALTDMEYVVFHAAIQTASDCAHLEFYIRHLDGSPISSEPEKQRVIQCLQAAVERRASKGLKLELCTQDRPGLLAEVTRAFRESAINVTGAEISTRENTVRNVFYVTDANGNRADLGKIESVRERIGFGYLNVKESSNLICQRNAENQGQHQGGGGTVLDSLGSLVMKNLYNLGLIKSHS